MSLRFVKIALLSVFMCSVSESQMKTENPFLKWSTWALLQFIPSPTYFEDKDSVNASLKFGLEWQVIPLSYSFTANKYVSKVSLFYIPPVKRFSGSAELFFEPSIVTGNFKYAGLRKFMYKTGIRLVLPVAHGGEYLSASLGAGYYRQNSPESNIDGPTFEAGVYSFFGMLGLKFSYNQNAVSRYNIGLYFKYY